MKGPGYVQSRYDKIVFLWLPILGGSQTVLV